MEMAVVPEKDHGDSGGAEESRWRGGLVNCENEGGEQMEI